MLKKDVQIVDKKITSTIILTLILIIGILSSYVIMRSNENAADIKVYNETESFEVADEILVLYGWIGAEEISVMKEPSESSEVIDSIQFNERIEYTIYNSDWFEVTNRDFKGYVSSQYVLDEDTGYTSYEQYALDTVIGYASYDVPRTSGFKSYMDYRSITSTSSRQYELQNRYATTGDYGIRMVDGRYCVAVGSYFTDDVGQYFDLILENGTVIPCVLGDQKANKDTDSNNIVTVHNGCVSEFIVDMNSLNDSAKKHGNMSMCDNLWQSRVVAVKVYNKNIFDE